jgi:TrbL/VirB6 plasmid conjugal transfer protein
MTMSRWSFIAGLIMAGLLAGNAAQAQINPLALIAQYESGDNPTAQSPNSSASGLFGDLSSTWAQALTYCGCGTPSQYPTAASAPASIQIAANAALIDQEGLAPWLCSGCDAPFAAAVTADGGSSAFLTSGLSIDPTTYVAADNSVAAYFAAAGGGTTVTEDGTPVLGGSTTGTIGAAATAAGVTGTAGSAFSPFSYLWNQYSAGIAQPFNNAIGTIQSTVAPYVGLLLVLMIIALGVGMWRGLVGTDVMLNRILRIAAVVALTGIGSTWYQDYVVNLFTGLPVTFSNALLGGQSTNPAAGFDAVIHAFNGAVSGVWWDLPWGVSTVIGDGILIALAALIVYIAVAMMFAVWIVAQALLGILLVIGPLIILALLFDYMRGWFDRWLAAAAMLVLVTVVTDLIAGLVQQIVLQAINALPSTGQSTQNTLNLVGIAMIVVVLSAAISLLPLLIQFLAGAAGAPAMNQARTMLSQYVYRPASAAATGAVGAAAALVR